MQWHAYADGVVVYVAETCETHLLPPDCEAFLEASIAGLARNQAAGVETVELSGTDDPGMTLEEAALRELLDLKILEPAH